MRRHSIGCSLIDPSVPGSGDPASAGRAQGVGEVQLDPDAIRAVMGADRERQAGRLGDGAVDRAGVLEAVPVALGNVDSADVNEDSAGLDDAEMDAD